MIRRLVGRLAHVPAEAQLRLWRLLILGCAALFLTIWATLAVLTHMAEKSRAAAGRTYLEVAPMVAETMDLRRRAGRLSRLPPLIAAERVAAGRNIGADRLRLVPRQGQGQTGLGLHAERLTLSELTELLRDLRLSAGLNTVSASIHPTPDDAKRATVDLVLAR